MRVLEESSGCAACSVVAGEFGNCEAGLKLDVRTYQSFSSINRANPIGANRNLQDDFTWEPGIGGDIMVVRAFYEWPTFVPGFGNDRAALANGKRLLTGAAAFRNEPF